MLSNCFDSLRISRPRKKEELCILQLSVGYHPRPLEWMRRTQPSGTSMEPCSTPAGMKKYMPFLISVPFSLTVLPSRTMPLSSEGWVCLGARKPLGYLRSITLAPVSLSILNTLIHAPFINSDSRAPTRPSTCSIGSHLIFSRSTITISLFAITERGYVRFWILFLRGLTKEYYSYRASQRNSVPARRQKSLKLLKQQSKKVRPMVRIVENWQVFEAYANNRRPGFYQVIEDSKNIEIRILVSEVGFKKTFPNAQDSLFKEILSFCEENRSALQRPSSNEDSEFRWSQYTELSHLGQQSDR